MDKKLLDSLNNLSLALEDIANALKDKGEAKSATAKAIQGGDFINEIKEINIGVKQLQEDTKEILKNQQTIMSMGKSKKDDNKKEIVAEGLGKDKTSQKNFKEGLGVILLMATAVLALGIAFNLIGKVNFLSVIALSIALPLLAIGFSKVHKVLKEVGFDPKKDSINFIIAITSIAIGITASSWILSMVTPLSFSKFFTVTFIALAFGLLAPSIMKFMMAFKEMSWMQLIKSVVAFPLILPAIALGIAFASWAFQLIKPIGFAQFLTAVGIGIVFAIISFGIRKMLKSFDKLNPAELKNAAIFLPLILPAIALGMALSSYAFQLIKPITMVQFLTALGISAVFAIISFALKPIAAGMRRFKWTDVPKIPVFFSLLALAIMLSSHILSFTKPITAGKLLNIAFMGLILGGLVWVMTTPIRILSKLGLKGLIMGSLGIVLVATTIMVSSHILSLGNYKKYPDWKWALGVGLSMIMFTPAVVALGIIAMTGVGALAIFAGAGMVLVVAGTIVATSHILAKGNYSKYPPLSWSASVALSMGAFALGMTVLGALIVGTFGLGGVMLAAGSEAVLMVADTIVQTSYILQKGKYTGGPTKEWAEGIAISLGAFSPVYAMLMKNSIFSIFGGGGVGPEDFAKAIRTVSQGIIDAALFFSKNKVAFKAGPPKAWAEGVGLAIGAFSPVYKVLAANSGWLKSGVSVKDMAKAIVTISQGIVDAAKFFAKNKSPFNKGNYPSKEWGEGVGAALGAFAPVFQALHEDTGWFTSGDDVINNMKKAISVISSALVSSAMTFMSVGPDAWKTYPTSSWADGVKSAINSFIDLYKSLAEEETTYSDLNLITQYARQMASTAEILGKNRKYFDYQVDPDFVSKMSKNIIDYQNLVKSMSGFGSSDFMSMVGLDPVQRVANGMVKIASAYDRLARAVKSFSSALNGLDPVRVSSFTRLTGNIAMLSAMDSTMFSNMMKVLEQRSGVFANMLKTQANEMSKGRPVVKAPGSAGSRDKREDSSHIRDAKGETQLQKLDKVIGLLRTMNQHVGTIDQFLQNPKSIENSDIGNGDG